jgi:tRNA pseudouridine32 synthase / 23S rRNA pseudouridine746 synthase
MAIGTCQAVGRQRIACKPQRVSPVTAQTPRTKRAQLPTVNGVSPSVMVLPILPQDVQFSTALSFLELSAHIPIGQSWLVRMQSGLVLSDAGVALAPDAPYHAGQRIYYYRHVPDEPRIPFDETILYQDAHLLVADKPHFLPVSPTGRYVQETLLVRLKKRTGLNDLVPIHRIDRDTAGLVLFSVQPASRDAYAALFRQRAVEKCYEAIAPYRADLHFPRVHTSRMVHAASFMQMQEVAGTPNTETHMALLERRGALARYQLRPVTGKRHQLRMHMLSLGIPICGDAIYPVLTPEPALEALDYSAPLQLLAQRIAFADPVSGLAHRFNSLQGLQFPAG